MQPQQDQNYWEPNATETPIEQPAPEVPSDVTGPAPEVPDSLSWQASEFVHHEKSFVWFVILVGVATALLLLDIFLIRSLTFGILIIVMTFAAIVVAQRPPRTVTYALSNQGITIDEKFFKFSEFKAFGVVQEHAFYSARLIPHKRFMPMVSVYFPPEYGERIVDIFGSVLPMQRIELDPIDKFVEKIRF